MGNKIKSRIIKMDTIGWKDLKWIQVGLKEISDEAYEKLKRSLILNDFSMPFHVWQDKDDIWILDGHHRQKAMIDLIENEKVAIPDQLPAVFVRCKNKKEASKLVLVYSSTYAGITSDGLIEFLKEHDLDWGELREELDIPDINLDYYFEEPGKLPDVDVEGEQSRPNEYLIVTFDEPEQYYTVKEKLGIKGLGRTIAFKDLSDKWDF